MGIARGNGRDLVARMNARKGAIKGELTVASKHLAPLLERESKRILSTEIYSVPIPLKASADRATDLSKVPPQLRAQVLKSRQFEKPLSAKSKLRGNVSRGKYGQWKRTGNLLRQERARAAGVLVVLTNGADYADARFRLGTPEGRQIKSQGVRSCQWQIKAIVTLRGVILEVRRRHLLQALQHR